MAEKPFYHDNHQVHATYQPIPWLLKALYVLLPIWGIWYFAFNFNAQPMMNMATMNGEPSAVIAMGHRLAAEQGCFACHGIDGKGKVENPGHKDKFVPGWNGDDLAGNNMVYPILLREQIERAVVPTMFQDPTDIGGQEFAALKMQPWLGRLSTQQINYIMAYIYSINPFLQAKMKEVLAGQYDQTGFLTASGNINPAYVGFSYGDVWRLDGTPLGPPSTAEFPPGKDYPEEYSTFLADHQAANPPQWTDDVREFSRLIGLK